MEVGPVTHRLSWAEVKHIIAAGALEKLGRLPDQLAYYRQQSEVMRREFVTVGDFILHHRFGLPYLVRPTDGKKYVELPTTMPVPAPSSTTTVPEDRAEPDNKPIAERVVWAPNDYPYALEDDIGHFLLWSLKPLEPERLEQIVKQHVRPDEEFVYFINPPSLQSVKNVCHAHVLVYHHLQQRPPSSPLAVDHAPPELPPA